MSKITGLPLGTVKFYAAALRTAGILPVGGRGRSARPITAREAAILLLVSIVTETAARVSEAYDLLVADRGGVPYSEDTERAARYIIDPVAKKPTGIIRLDVFDDVPAGSKQLPRFVTTIAADTFDILTFVSCIIQACIDCQIFPNGAGGKSRTFWPGTHVDYDPVERVFSFLMVVDQTQKIIGFDYVGNHSPFSVMTNFFDYDRKPEGGVVLFHNLKRLNFLALIDMAAVLADVAEPDPEYSNAIAEALA